MGKNYAIFNELILYGMRLLPKSYSDKVVGYLTGDFDKKVFDYTSGLENKLELVKEILKVHAASCTKTCLDTFLVAVEKYVSPQSCEWYKDRIDYNSNIQKEYSRVYWSFWGDFQYNILQSIPYEHLSSKDKALLSVLDRKFNGKADRYINTDGHYGWVKSPVTGKILGKKQWLQIITNGKISDRNSSHWKKVKGGFIESSLSMYAGDFQNAVKSDPVGMIKMVIDNKEDVVPAYVDSMYSGAEFSDAFEQVEQKLWEQMFSEFPCDMKGQRALYFCGIIEKANIYSWSDEVIERLKEIAINYEGEEGGKTNDSKELSCDELINRFLNCIKGNAISAMGHLLWNNKTLFTEFKDVVDKLILDDDEAVRMACFNILWPIYNIDRKWAETRILSIYESDVRMAGFRDSKGMFFRLYSKYKERTLAIIRKSFETDDKRLAKMGGYAICEFYIRYNEFETVMHNMEKLSEEQMNAILHMAVIYLEYDEYREISKDIILRCKNSEIDIEFSLGRIFIDNLVDVERDSEFLKTVMKSKVSRRMVYSFVHYLEENAYSLVDYAEVIIALCNGVLNTPKEQLERKWGIESDISKLIIALYDETANSDKEAEQKIAENCLELWDVMFEKQIGQVRELSRNLMNR